MSIAADGQTDKCPRGRGDLQQAIDLVEQLRQTSDEEQLRYLFRELAKQLLDPGGECELTICDNEGTVLGYFVPVKRWFQAKAEQEPPAPSCDNMTEFLQGAVSARDLLERVINQSSR